MYREISFACCAWAHIVLYSNFVKLNNVLSYDKLTQFDFSKFAVNSFEDGEAELAQLLFLGLFVAAGILVA